jgi:hypothetical protein
MSAATPSDPDRQPTQRTMRGEVIFFMHLLGMFAGCEFSMRQIEQEEVSFQRRNRKSHPLQELYDDHFVPEVSRILIQTAAAIRLLDDMAGSAVVAVTFPVGELVTAKKKTTLTIREACNKIIHASFVKFDLGRLSDTQIDFARPTTVELQGRKNKAKWTARLQIVQFVTAAAIVTYRYDEALDELHPELANRADLEPKM